MRSFPKRKGNLYNGSMTFENLLTAFYRDENRSLPWRNEPDFYHVFVSEVMLQQTQVKKVMPYYQRFLAAFPTVESLASASEEKVLKLWEGLGYYSRARNLLAAAQTIVVSRKGKLPGTEAELLSLPGIGIYTAHAILAIAFHKKAIAVDANLCRIFCRLTENTEADLAKQKESCEAFFRDRLKDSDPSVFNQALMDVGEQICLAHGVPHCEQCPLSSLCRAAVNKSYEKYPILRKNIAKKKENWTVAVLSYKDKIGIRKRPSSGLLASLYEFDSLPGILSEADLRKALRKQGFSVKKLRPLGPDRQVFSHLNWNLVGYAVELTRNPASSSLIFVSPETLESSFSLPSAFLRYYRRRKQEV